MIMIKKNERKLKVLNMHEKKNTKNKKNDNDRKN